MDLPQLNQTDVQAFLICLVRIGSLMGTMPLFSGIQNPVRVRAALAIMLTLVVFPVVRGSIPAIPFAPLELLVLVAGEALLGVMVGFISRFVFTAAELGGTIVGYSMGFAAANVFDPQNQRQISLMSQFQNVLAILIFLVLNIHHLFIRAIVESFRLLPPGSWNFSGQAIPYLMELAGRMFVLGIQLSAPVLAALLLTSLVLGILARVFPQLNVFLLSFPLNIGLAFLIIGMTLNLMVTLLGVEFGKFDNQFMTLLQQL